LTEKLVNKKSFSCMWVEGSSSKKKVKKKKNGGVERTRRQKGGERRTPARQSSRIELKRARGGKLSEKTNIIRGVPGGEKYGRKRRAQENEDV